MLKKTSLMIALILAVLAGGVFPGGAQAAPDGPTALIWLVHGVNGLDMGNTVSQYPLDIWVEGVGCIVKNTMFMNVAGPYRLPSGNFRVRYSVANLANPCSTTPLLETNLYLIDNGAYNIVAHLGAGGGLALSSFRVNLTRTTNNNGKARFNIANTTSLAAIDVFARPYLRKADVIANDLGNGQMLSFLGKSGKWKVWFTDASGVTTLNGPMLLQTRSSYAYFIFLVGSATNGFYTISFSANTRRIIPTDINWQPLP